MDKEQTSLVCVRAKSAGFCFGVSLAIQKLDEALVKVEAGKSSHRIFTLGPIIHNPLLVARYEERGAVCIEHLEGLCSNDQVLIRAHGVPREMEELLREKGVMVLDATCPKVKRAQLSIAEQASKGLFLLLFGEKEHPEVQGLLSYASNGAAVFETEKQLEALLLTHSGPFFLAAQTTQDKNRYQHFVNIVEQKLACSTLALDTICGATITRQKEVVALAKQLDCLIVVGGYNSGNTKRLAFVAEEHGLAAFHVETAEELDLAYLKDFKRIGVTAGASTPEDQILALEEKINNYLSGLNKQRDIS